MTNNERQNRGQEEAGMDDHAEPVRVPCKHRQFGHTGNSAMHFCWAVWVFSMDLPCNWRGRNPAPSPQTASAKRLAILNPVHHYRKVTGYRLALLINFGAYREPEYERIVR
jgi:hypothetical protein